MHAVDNVSRPVTAPDHGAAVGVLMDWLEQHGGTDALAAVGHRVVHGGPKYCEPQRITASVVQELHRLGPLDPNHMPEEIRLIETFQRRYPDLPQVACFDTAFHHELPPVARILAIPRRYEAQGIRRYGFHGVSYAFLMEQLVHLGDPAARVGRVILAHLGNGASLTAVRNGKSVDTSMGFTPAAGVPMGTRSGDLDPGLVSFLRAHGRNECRAVQRHGQFSVRAAGNFRDQFRHARFARMRIAGHARGGSNRAVLLPGQEMDRRLCGALGGLDTLVFAGGIGENAPTIRARTCDGLGFLGIEIDEAKNAANEGVISGAASRITVRVMHSDEELMIAKMVGGVLGLG